MFCFGILVMYCQLSNAPIAPASDYCRIAQPITWVAADTRPVERGRRQDCRCAYNDAIRERGGRLAAIGGAACLD